MPRATTSAAPARSAANGVMIIRSFRDREMEFKIVPRTRKKDAHDRAMLASSPKRPH